VLLRAFARFRVLSRAFACFCARQLFPAFFKFCVNFCLLFLTT
jgi:hypothetical protein